MKKIITLFSLVFLSLCVFAQEKTEVLLVGTYHFGGNTTDVIKVADDSILSNRKQGELSTLLDKLEKFKPEKIYVENEISRQQFWDSIYVEYKGNKRIKMKNEIFQIGIKLASRLHLDKGVTCVDWHIQPVHTFAEKEYITLYQKMNDFYAVNNIPDEEQQSEYETQVIQEIKGFNNKIPDLELLEVYRILNSENYLNKMFYANITSLLDVDTYDMNIFWSQNNMIRNVNVYQNIIQDILKDKPKRVLILYGVGHIKSLKNYLEAHPAVEIVETKEYLE
jgi:hypothetical protein